jgi:arrestin-related trafficking adapter 3/6
VCPTSSCSPLSPSAFAYLSLIIYTNPVAHTFDCKGIGARRIDITEEHCVFHAFTNYFNAGKTYPSRRTASIGPGVSYYAQDIEADLDDDFYRPDWNDIRAHLPQTHGGTLDAARSRSRSRHDLSRSNSTNAQPIHAEVAGPSTYTDSQLFHPQGPPSSSRSLSRLTSASTGASTSTSTATVRPFPISDRLHARRLSVDSSHFQRMPINETNHEHGLTPPHSSQLEQMAPIPPYSLLPVSPTSAPSSPSSPTAAAQSLEEFRNSLHSNLRNSQLYQSERFLHRRIRHRFFFPHRADGHFM